MKQSGPATDNIADSLKAYLGEDVVAVIRELKKKKDYSEFKLADAIRKEVNETRNFLYKLNDLNLASFIKKKDRKVGWYIHYWTFHDDRVGAFLLNEKRARLEVLKELAAKDGRGESFMCENNCVDVDFDRAFDLSFHCPECGELLSQGKGRAQANDDRAEFMRLEKDILALESQKAKEGEERYSRNERSIELENEKRRGR